jgi:hypothetical protein
VDRDKVVFGDPDMVWGEEPEQPMDDITLHDFELLCAKGYEIKALIAAIDDTKKAHLETLAQVEKRVLSYMEKYGKKSYKTSQGTIVASTRFQVTLPKTPDDVKAFYDYLKAKGHFDELISVNYQKLNSYYKQEMEVAREEGNIGFKIPGIDEPKAHTHLQFRG